MSNWKRVTTTAEQDEAREMTDELMLKETQTWDTLQADIGNGKVKLVDGVDELLQQAKLTDADKQRMEEEEEQEAELETKIGFALIDEWEKRLGRELTDAESSSEEFINEFCDWCERKYLPSNFNAKKWGY
jgi:hypothetical protein